MTRYLLAVCTALAASLTAAQGTKWHPGHYVMLDGGARLDQHMWHIDELRNDRNIQGVMVRFSWYELEPERDVYDFSLIDTYLEKVGNTNTTKRLVVRIIDRAFFESDPAGIVPDYLLEDPVFNGGVAQSRTGYVARLWEEPVMSRLISLYQALGQRYDSAPLFEGAFTEETTLSFPFPDFPDGYSHELLAEQYVRFIAAVKPTMPTSNLFLNANWIGSSTIMAELVQAIRDTGVGAGGSNVLPGRPTQGQQVLIGVNGADYRLEVPIANGVESGELGGSLGDFTPEEIGAYAHDELYTHYLFWIRNTWSGSAEQRWYTGILPYLRSEPPLRTRCPNVYGVCVTDDPRPPPVNVAPSVSAGPDASVRLPEDTVTLAGSVSDDGQPAGTTTSEWSLVAGPVQPVFADAASPTSQVTFVEAGAYELRLTASDGELSAEDTMIVTVAAANVAPDVDAGDDVAIEWPTASVTLSGSVSDDGVPGTALALEWTHVGGPSPVVFGSPNEPSTSVDFPSEGVFILRLAASDGELAASDDVAVTVGAAPPAGGEPGSGEDPDTGDPDPGGDPGSGGDPGTGDGDPAGDPDGDSTDEPGSGGGTPPASDAEPDVAPVAAGSGGGGSLDLFAILALGALSLAGRRGVRPALARGLRRCARRGPDRSRISVPAPARTPREGCASSRT